MNGIAGDNDNHDTYFDDSFSDIPDEEFRQLEQDAVASTRRQQDKASRPQHGDHIAVDSDSLRADNRPGIQDRADQFSDHADTADGPQGVRRQELQHADSEETMLDEDGLPDVVQQQPPLLSHRQPDEMSLREQHRLSRFAPLTAQTHRRPPPRTQGTRRENYQVSEFQAYAGPEQFGLKSGIPNVDPITSAVFEEEDIRSKIEELQAKLEEANGELLLRRGENINIRAKQAEEQKTHQRQLSVLQKLRQEDADKHKQEVVALTTKVEKAIYHNQFLEREVNDGGREIDTLKRQLKDRTAGDKQNDSSPTPKRDRKSLRDGFDDGDLMQISPVKSGGGRRSNQGTPTGNKKRKQQVVHDIGVPPLVLKPPESTEDNKQTHRRVVAQPEQNSPAYKIGESGRHLRLVQQVLSYQAYGSSTVLLDRLSKFAFPATPNTTLSSRVLVASAKLDGNRLPADLLQIFLDIWAQALKEKYHVCIDLLIEVVARILDLDMFVINGTILQNLLPLLQRTGEVNGKVRFRLLSNKDWLGDPEKTKPTYDEHLNTTKCLSLLNTVAALIADDTSLMTLFWETMETDFVLMNLNGANATADITLMLQLLAYSIRQDTFGNICLPEEQVRMETYIIDRICYLLWEIPKHDADLNERPVTRKVVSYLRLDCLLLLTRLIINASPNPFDPSLAHNHGTVFICHHPTAIARIVRSIYEELSQMYNLTTNHKLHAQLVNEGVRLLHFILTSPSGKGIDLQRALAGTNGGAHRHRVALTRIAFSEGEGPDEGITDDTVRMATELLEEVVTLDEGEELMEVFGHGGGESGSRSKTPRASQG